MIRASPGFYVIKFNARRGDPDFGIMNNPALKISGDMIQLQSTFWLDTTVFPWKLEYEERILLELSNNRRFFVHSQRAKLFKDVV
mmetsp:Transcript_5733/g.6225  ORF Transcript_5733/g.6225 Transcript_5733/m.6225 type:complete len:85 (-) Transcript_5733:28-282(-)